MRDILPHCRADDVQHGMQKKRRSKARLRLSGWICEVEVRRCRSHGFCRAYKASHLPEGHFERFQKTKALHLAQGCIMRLTLANSLALFLCNKVRQPTHTICSLGEATLKYLGSTRLRCRLNTYHHVPLPLTPEMPENTMPKTSCCADITCCTYIVRMPYSEYQI